MEELCCDDCVQIKHVPHQGAVIGVNWLAAERSRLWVELVSCWVSSRCMGSQEVYLVQPQ